jgi:hypothetical protein
MERTQTGVGVDAEAVPRERDAEHEKAVQEALRDNKQKSSRLEEQVQRLEEQIRQLEHPPVVN